MSSAEKDTLKHRKQINSLTEQLLHAFEELDLLHGVCEIFASSANSDETNKHILSEAMEILPANMGWVVHAEGELSGWKTLKQNVDAKTVAVINEKIVRDVIKTGTHVWTDDLQQELATPDIDLPRAFLCVPLRTKNEILGAICLGKTLADKVFTAGDLKLVQILCAPCATAILQKRVERTNQLKRYLSPQLAETILKGQDIQLSNKRAELTIFFCQLKGFSEAAEEMEPEELIDILNEYLCEMTEIVFKYEGTLDKFILGSIFGFFGDPIFQEDHPVRAVKMAISMQNRFSEIQDEWLRADYKPFGLGIGISTGYVTVGNVGSPNRIDYTAIGKNVILARKLAEIAEGGQIAVSQKTHNKIKDTIETHFLGSKAIGKQPVRVYEVHSNGLAEERAGSSSDLVLTAGKEEEYLLRKGKVSHYKIIDKLGEGGMGKVYKARDLKLDRTVALKILPRAMTNETMKKRFLREAKVLSALNHPNIATIYEIDEGDRVSFIAMEYIEGKTLAEMIKVPGLTTREVIDIAIPVAEALLKAHEKNITHRDIKPTNIIRSNEGYIKVLDFGLAKVNPPVGITGTTEKPTDTAALTQAGTLLGTVAYMSPEQARGFTVDQRTDIFSFGVVLYELLTTKLPFTGVNNLAILHAIIAENPLPIRTLNPEVPGELEAIVDKTLLKEPNDRYQSMKDMLVDLTRLGRHRKRYNSWLGAWLR